MAAARSLYSGRVAARRPSLYVIGDSISLHYGPYLERFLAGGLTYRRKEDEAVASEASLDYPHGPFGENAGDSGMVLAYLRSRPEAVAAADVVLLNCGLHDLKVGKASGRHQVPLDAYRDNLAAIVELLAGSPTRLVWCTISPVHDAAHAEAGANLAFSRVQADVERYNAAATELMHAAGVPLIDLHGFTLSLAADGEPADLYVDHVHFATWVRAAQGAFLAGWLRGAFGSGDFQRVRSGPTSRACAMTTFEPADE